MSAIRRAHCAAIVAALAGLGATTAGAQGRDAECRAEHRRQFPATNVTEAFTCLALATEIVEPIRQRAVLPALMARVPERDLQSRAATQPATAGGPAQGEAVPSVQPIALAAGAIAAAGTGKSHEAITAITLNPSIFLPGGDKVERANRSRVGDITLLVPLSDIDRDEDGSPDYVGVRARVNFGGRISLDRVNRAAARLAQRTTDLATELEGQLVTAPDLPGCVSAYRQASLVEADIRRACGGVIAGRLDEVAVAEFRESVSAIRDSTDAKYFGLDLRFDAGDPSLGTLPNAEARSMFVGFAAGGAFRPPQPGDPSLRYHARAGGVSIGRTDQTLPDSLRGTMSVDAAFGLEYSYPSAFQPLRASLGAEYRRGGVPPVASEVLRTDYLTFRFALEVPISASNSIAIAFAKPSMGKEKPRLSVNGNWQMLLPGLLPRSP